MTELNRLIGQLDNIAERTEAGVSEKYDAESIREAARILRAAAGVDVAGLMALHDAAVAAAIAVALERKGDRHGPTRAALESALRLALAAREGRGMTDDELRTEVRQRIEKTGLTQENYAAAHGYSPQYLSDFLNGRRAPGEKILDGEGLQAHTVYIDPLQFRVGVTGHNRFEARGDRGPYFCKKCNQFGLFSQIHSRSDGSECGYLASLAAAAPKGTP